MAPLGANRHPALARAGPKPEVHEHQPDDPLEFPNRLSAEQREASPATVVPPVPSSALPTPLTARSHADERIGKGYATPLPTRRQRIHRRVSAASPRSLASPMLAS
jgi:hypothetical protein